MLPRTISSINTHIKDHGYPCGHCRGTGGIEPPKTYEEVWGKTLVNGSMVCEPCQGTGITGGIAI